MRAATPRSAGAPSPLAARHCTTTFIAGLRQTGIVATLVLDGPMTGPAFCAYVEQFLAPALVPATSWCSTTSPRTRSLASARQSPPLARLSSICRPTVPLNPSAAFAKLNLSTPPPHLWSLIGPSSLPHQPNYLPTHYFYLK